VAGVTSALPFNARDTVATETFASRATSLIVTTARFPRGLMDRAHRMHLCTECKRFHS